MCQRHRPSFLHKRTACRLTALDDVLLMQILRFSTARDVEAMTVAARVISYHVLPHLPEIWRTLFIQRWTTLNFPLDTDATLVIEPRLRRLFSEETTESRMLQLLTHAVVPVPSYVDIEQITKSAEYSEAKHQIRSMQRADTRVSHVVSFAFNGDELGDDRSVRANVPFPTGFHVTVFKRREAGSVNKSLYQIGLVASGYFEIHIVHRERPSRAAETEGEGHQEEVEVTSLGLVPGSFPSVGRQPGWNQKSFGYHGDDGRFYHQTTRGRLFGPRFGVNDTVGCGVRRNMTTAQSHVFFTHNGKELARAQGSDVESSHISWYPAVGVDSYNEVRVNFGNELFAHDGIVDELFAECDPSVVTPMDLPWYDIQEYSIECLVWGRQQTGEARAQADTDERNDPIAEEGELVQEEKTCAKKWIVGMLSRRQQNRLASSEENANEERVAVGQLSELR
ncbi:unnamed protein product [Peronospora belbahrii]|uniref:SPRY domain-containing protein n=1 Tax=Peronospora belbahrii TaxID=622444 RepID=A0AAU9KYC2_9STRA|nr:unnamed protein product [Peronospora belbahrii]